MEGTVIAVCLSGEKGVKKKDVGSARAEAGTGLVGDAHAGEKNRQVSLLAQESIDKIRRPGLEIRSGDFAENITTRGIALADCRPGERLKIGGRVVLEVTQIGKECHDGCEIFRLLGDCLMPREGVFTRVLEGGVIRSGDSIVRA